MVDLDAEGLPFDVTLVVANQTAAGAELVERLEALADEGPRRFIVVVPAGLGRRAARSREARERLRQLLDVAARATGIVAAGMIGDPDPYTAAMNAVQYFHISEIVISTLPEGTLAVGGRQARRARASARPTSRSSTSSPRDEARRTEA